MANNNLTIFQRIGNMFRGNNGNYVPSEIVTTPPSHRGLNDRVLFTTNDKAEYERKLKTYQQQKYLSYQWQRAQADNAMDFSLIVASSASTASF